jgi:2-dehydro-3-deoxyglucarate aldolase
MLLCSTRAFGDGIVKENHFYRELADGGVAMGGFMQIGHPAVAEVLARAGLHWVIFDTEHGGIDLETGTALIRAMSAWLCTPFVRLPINDSAWIARFLDAGVGGIVVPMVNSAEQAKAAVDAARYPPDGRRGFGYNRANNYGVDFDEYAAGANAHTAVIVQIEHIDGVENIDRILDVKGIDGVFVGPYDLTGSMGIVGQMDHPKMTDALERIINACQRHGVPAGLHVVQPQIERVQKAIDDGFRIIGMSLDNVMLYHAARSFLTEARQLVDETK